MMDYSKIREFEIYELGMLKEAMCEFIRAHCEGDHLRVSWSDNYFNDAHMILIRTDIFTEDVSESEARETVVRAFIPRVVAALAATDCTKIGVVDQ